MPSRNINKSKRRVIYIVTAAVLSLIILYGAIFALLSYIDRTNVANDPSRLAMESYLNQKYGKDFTVGRTRDESSGFEVLFVAASAKDDKGIELTVGKTKDGFFDSYHNGLWSSQQQPVVDELTKKISDVNPEVVVSINPSPTLLKELDAQLPSYTDIRTQNGSELTYGVDLQIKTVERNYDGVVQALSDNLGDLASYMDSQNVGNELIGITIWILSEKVHYSCQLSSKTSDIATKVGSLSSCFKKSID